MPLPGRVICEHRGRPANASPFYMLHLYRRGWKNMRRIWSHLLAMSSLLVLPTTLLYFFAQRYFIHGIVISGIKG